MRKNFFICFIGIDATGKTTLAQRLAGGIGKSGIESKYVRGRFETFKLLKPFIFVVKKTILLGKKTDSSAEGTGAKRKIFSNRLLAKVWEFLVLLDYFPQLVFKIGLPLMLGRSISCDRYIYDTMADLAVDLDYPVSKMRKMLENLFQIVPKPDVAFLIDLPEEIAYQRNLPKKDNLSLEYLAQRRKLYLSLRGRPEVEVLDGSKEPEELFRIIRESLNEKTTTPRDRFSSS